MLKQLVKQLCRLSLSSFCLLLSLSFGRSAYAVDRAELQFALCETNAAAVVRTLGGKITKHDLRKVFYLETEERDLQKHGAVLRFRITKNGVKSAAKKAFYEGDELPEGEFKEYGAICELDSYLSTSKVGCSVKDEHAKMGELNRDQKEFLKANGIASEVWKASTLWGPIPNDTWVVAMGSTELALDSYQMPNGQVFMELSTRVKLVDAMNSQKQMTAYIRGLGLKLCPAQVGVTKKILDQLITQ